MTGLERIWRAAQDMKDHEETLLSLEDTEDLEALAMWEAAQEVL